MTSALAFRKYQIEVATADGPRGGDIAAFLHAVYAGELGYYPTSEDRRFDDAFGRATSYILILDEGAIAGLQGVILCSGDYPLRHRIGDAAVLDGFGAGGVELRLLSIAKDRRKSDIFLAIVVGINHYLRAQQQLTFALTSSKAHNVRLYERMGFKTFAQSEVFGSTSCHMHAARETIEGAADRYLKFAARE